MNLAREPQPDWSHRSHPGVDWLQAVWYIEV
jgi:hypothetical protein